MSDFLSFLNKILYYIKSFRLYEPIFICSVLIAAFFSTAVTKNLQLVAIAVLGNQNFVPLISFELIAFITWILFSILLRNLLTLVDTLILNVISKQQKECSIDFTKDTALERFSREWKTQGNVYFENGLMVTDTHSGILLKPKFLWLKRVWFNFESKMCVEFRQRAIIETSYNETSKDWIRNENTKLRQVIGVILRAQNLDDYYMLEIWKIDKDIVLKPHVRISGVWRPPIFNSPISYKLKNESQQVDFRLVVKDHVARLFVDKDEKPLVWIIPTEYEIEPGKQDVSLKDGLVAEIPFNSRAGMFGFRNYGNEMAVVKSLEIKSL